MDIVSQNAARRLAQKGIEVRGYEPGMLHAKLAFVDRSWAAVGSFNMGVDSFSMNFEAAVVSRDPAFSAALADQLDRDLAASCVL